MLVIEHCNTRDFQAPVMVISVIHLTGTSPNYTVAAVAAALWLLLNYGYFIVAGAKAQPVILFKKLLNKASPSVQADFCGPLGTGLTSFHCNWEISFQGLFKNMILEPDIPLEKNAHYHELKCTSLISSDVFEKAPKKRPLKGGNTQIFFIA